MSLELSQLTDNGTIDNSNIKRGFLKIFHQQASNSNDSDQNVEFNFGEKINYHQISNTYLHYEKTIEKDVAIAANRVFAQADVIRLATNALAYCFKEARLSSTGGSDVEHIKYRVQVSTIMRASKSKDGDFLTHFDKIDESQPQIQITSLKQLLINNHDIALNKGKIEQQFPLQKTLSFVEFLKND